MCPFIFTYENEKFKFLKLVVCLTNTLQNICRIKRVYSKQYYVGTEKHVCIDVVSLLKQSWTNMDNILHQHQF